MKVKVTDGPTPSQFAVVIAVRDLKAVIKDYQEDWSYYIDDPIALDALRGLALRFELYQRHQLGRRGRCTGACRRWRVWPSRDCRTNDLLHLYASSGADNLWFFLLEAVPGKWTSLEDVRAWLADCREEAEARADAAAEQSVTIDQEPDDHRGLGDRLADYDHDDRQETEQAPAPVTEPFPAVPRDDWQPAVGGNEGRRPRHAKH